MALQAMGMFPAFSPLTHSPLAQSPLPQVRMIIMGVRFMMMMIT